MLSGSFVDVEGGTIYECTSDYHGGAICMNESYRWHTLLIMRNCRIYHCKSYNSIKSDLGGAIYMHSHCGVILENMTIQDCYSESDGGAVFMHYKNTILRAKNTRFLGNKAYNSGGAIMIRDNTDHNYYTYFDIENCIFSGNKANDEGGAIYIDGYVENKPTSIRNCIFRCNESGKNGSAMYVNRKNVVLADCSLTDNTTKKKGAIFVEADESIGIKGLMVVKGNKSEENSGYADLVLEDGVLSDAFVYNGGLYKGSYVSINTDDDDDMTIVRNISEYQKQYYHSSGGSLKFNKEKYESVAIVIASQFGRGSLIVVTIMVAVSVMSVITVVVLKKRKRGQKNEDTDEE